MKNKWIFGSFAGLLHSTIAIFVVAFLSGCSDSSNNDYSWPTSATVTAVVISSNTLYNGQALDLTATVESAKMEQDVQVDFYFVPSGQSSADCTAPETLPSWHVLLPEIAQQGPDAPPVTTFQQRFFSTSATYAPGFNNRRALVTQSIQLGDIPAGSYNLVASIAGTGCKLSEQPVVVAQPTLPDMLHSEISLNNNSFRLPEVNNRKGKNRPGPDFKISSEMANNGLVVSEPVEVGFTINIGGSVYPLEIEVINSSGLPVKQAKYIYQQKAAGESGVIMDQKGIRGANYHVFLSDAAKTALSGMSADADCVIQATIDPDNKIAEISKENNTASLTVRFLAGDCACTPSDPTTPIAVFCFGPDASYASDSWSAGGMVYAGYQFAGSSTDPAYLAYSENSTGVPNNAHFHTASWVKVGISSTNNYSPVDALLDLQYHLPPVQSGSTLDFADFSGNFRVLGCTIFNFSVDAAVSVTNEKDLPLFDKDEKWVLFKDTVIVGDVVPVTFEFGVEGELSLDGKVTFDISQYLDASLDFTIGPTATFSAFGSVDVDLGIAEIGLDVDVTIISVNPMFNPYVKFYASPDYMQPLDSAVEIGANVPLSLGEGAGDFDIKVKTIFHKWSFTVLSWDGATQTINLITPLLYYFGPINLFETTLNDATPGTPMGAVYSMTPPEPNNGVTNWIGNIKLEAGAYTFFYQNVNSIELTPRGSGTPEFTSSGSCGDVPGSVTWTINNPNTYTLNVSTSNSCYASTSTAPAYVYWAQEGDSTISGLSGKTGNTGMSPDNAVAKWYFNSNPSSGSVVPAMYKDDTGVNMNCPSNTAISVVPAVNSPVQGLWIRWIGDLQLDLTQTGAVLLFNGNPPYTQTGCSSQIADTISVSIGTTPGGQNILAPTAVSLGANGQSIINVPQAATAGPYYYTLNYHPAYNGDNFGCTLAQANDVNIQMAVFADGNWAVSDTCTNSGAISSLVNIQDGPASASGGTLESGSLFSDSPCSGSSSASVQEYVSGAFNFTTAGDYDFIVGSSTDQSYRLWIDGQIVASRIVTDPTDTSQNPSYSCCESSASPTNICPTREKTFIQTLSAGYHFIEATFQANPGNWPQLQSENRIRWSPRNANEALVYIFGNQTELNNILYPPPGSQGLPANAVPYPKVEPLLIFKDSGQYSGATSLKMEWISAQDCNRATNFQFSCANSL